MKDKKKLIYVIVCVLGGIILGLLFINRTHTVTFNTQGGTIIRSVQVKHNKVVQVPTVPVMEGFVFDGWYCDGEEYDFNTPVKKNIVLNVKWKKIQ